MKNREAWERWVAAAADEVLLSKVKSAIADYLGAGRSPNPAGDIDDLLDEVSEAALAVIDAIFGDS